ncbi:MAG: glycoside hydrolase family 44 protein [Candidatus Acidiferrales bacterium]
MYRRLLRLAAYCSALWTFAGAWPGSGFAQTTPTLAVDAAGNPHAINPDIYGIANYGLDAGFAKEIRVPNIRWGGDGTTRYNWQVDSSNAGFDWYFMGGNGQATPVPSASVDLMINTYKTASNAHTLLTIPIIPYVNKSAAWNCSFPVSVYGPEQSTNPYVHPNGDSCGNSIAFNGTQLTDTDIYANHIDNTVALQQGWIQHLITTFGTAANGSVPYYQLDNEPGGWSNTHRDVEPTQPDYDTIISLGQQYAAMIKATDPPAKVFGPVDFTLGGWIGTPTKQNNLYAGQYYLQQMAAYDAAHQQRILDYFDEHYYGGGSTDALELADTRSLWDPTYNSGTWVEQYYFDGPMNLLPRFRSWIQTYYPGTKLSISEYSFAMGTNPLVDMLTETDVLGIFGVQALDFANMWNVPKPTDPLAYSFRIFRNFDGAGAQFGETSVNAASTDQGQLSVYGALRKSDGALTVVAINKTTSAIQTSLSLANFNSAPNAAVYNYSNANLTQIVAGAPVLVASNSVAYDFPAYSATVFVFTPATPALAATTTTVSASSTHLTAGQSVTITATVAPTSGTGTPTGTVNYFDGTSEILTSALGSGVSSLTTSSLAVGSHSITVQYLGDANFAASTSVPLVINVTAPAKIGTATSLSASATQATSAQSVTFSAAVKPQSGSGVPTGSISFLDGSTQISAATLNGGSASVSSASLAVGTHSITAAYSGDANYAVSNSPVVTVTVAAAPTPDYSLSMSASSLTVAQGGSGTLTITVTPQNGFKQPVGLACSGLPAGGTSSFNPQSVTPGAGAATAMLTVQAPAAGALSGPQNVRLTGPFPGAREAFLLILAMATLAMTAATAKQRRVASAPFAQVVPLLAMCWLVAGLLATVSCAGYSKPPTSGQPTSYVVTVTASGANAPTHTQQFTLLVKP